MSTKTIIVLVLYINILCFPMSFKTTTLLVCSSRHQLLCCPFPGNSSSGTSFKPTAPLAHLSSQQLLWYTFQGMELLSLACPSRYGASFSGIPFKASASLAYLSRHQLFWNILWANNYSDTTYLKLKNPGGSSFFFQSISKWVRLSECIRTQCVIHHGISWIW